MKKLAISVLAAVLLLGLAVTAWSDEGGGRSIVLKIGDPYMLVDGVRQEVDPGRGTKPVVLANRTLVPIRAIVENMGGTVKWIPQRQEVKAIVYEKVVTLTIGSAKAYIDTLPLPDAPATAVRVRKPQTLDVPAQTVNGRTMVPVRFVTESLGAAVNWNEAKQTVTITVGSSGTATAELPPVQGNTAPSQGNTTPTQENTAPAQVNNTPNQGNTTPNQGSTAPSGDTKPPTHQNPHANLDPGVTDPANYSDCAKCHPRH